MNEAMIEVIKANVENIKMALHNLKHYNAGGLDPDVADELNQIDFATEEIERELNAL